MGKLTITSAGMKALLKHAQNRLHTEVQTVIIPFAQSEVRVDTGRLRSTIRADYPEYDKDADEIVTEIIFGGEPAAPVVRDDKRGYRQVDYAADLEALTSNLSSDILFKLFTQY